MATIIFCQLRCAAEHAVRELIRCSNFINLVSKCSKHITECEEGKYFESNNSEFRHSSSGMSTKQDERAGEVVSVRGHRIYRALHRFFLFRVKIQNMMQMFLPIIVFILRKIH